MAATKPRLTPQDWASAALDAIAEGGVGAVAVEALAPRVGASKGSFYWHFQDRAALVDAALALWERTRTDAIIEELSDVADPQERLRRLFAIAFANPWAGRIEAALTSQPHHTRTARVLRRVTERRLDFLHEAFADLGFDAAVARRRALLTYTAFLGFFSVRQAHQNRVPAVGAELEAYVESALQALTRR